MSASATVSMTPLQSAIGGAMIGAAAAASMLLDGKIAGISGIAGPLLRAAAIEGRAAPKGTAWKGAFVLGLLSGGLGNWAFNAEFAFPGVLSLSWWRYVIAGICVGVGTRLGSGCTSGHGVCGLARLSLRSWVAVPTFMGVAIITAVLTSPTGSFSLAPVSMPSSLTFQLSAAAVAALLVLCAGLLPATRPMLSAYAAGLLFGLGRGISGMTSQDKVLGFLRLFGEWDPSLAFVMCGALAVTFPAFALSRREGAKPLTEGQAFENPKTSPIDKRLLLGNMLFGIGWGLCGVCPGPALAAAVPNLIRGPGASGWLFLLNLATILASWLACDRFLARCDSKCVQNQQAPLV